MRELKKRRTRVENSLRRRNSKKILRNSKKKTLMIKINNEKEKAFILHLFIKNFMQKLITMKKKEDVLSMWRLFNDNLKLFASFEKIKTRMKTNLTLINNVILSMTTMKRTYVVLTYNVRLSDVTYLIKLWLFN